MHPRVDDHPTPTAACPVGMELLYKALLPIVFCVSRVALVRSEPSPLPPPPPYFSLESAGSFGFGLLRRMPPHHPMRIRPTLRLTRHPVTGLASDCHRI